MHHLTALRIRQAQHRGLGDVRMGHQTGLDLFGEQVPGLGDDHAVLAPHQIQVALGILPPDVAHGQPFAHAAGCRGVLAVHVVDEQHGAADPDEAGLGAGWGIGVIACFMEVVA